jgi:transposase
VAEVAGSRAGVSTFVKNNAEGYAELGQWLGKRVVTKAHVCMEATGCYWEEAAQALADAGHTVSVVNPALVKAHGQSIGLRARMATAEGRAVTLDAPRSTDWRI